MLSNIDKIATILARLLIFNWKRWPLLLKFSGIGVGIIIYLWIGVGN